MAKIRSLQTSFTAGELDPAVSMRSDIDQYFQGAATMTNVIPQTQGGAKRRGGLGYVATKAGSGGSAGRLAEFEFNDQQEYLFSFTAGRVDIYDNSDQSLVTSITSSPVSNITEAMLPNLNWTQSADTFLLYHPDLEPIEITRTGATTFAASTQSLTNIPYFAFGSLTVTTPAFTLTPSAVAGNITLTSSGAYFASTDVGQLVTINDGLVRIKVFTSSTVVEGDVLEELRDTSAASSGDWEIEKGYEPVISASRGWPRTATFFQSRLFLGGTKSRPQTVLASKTGDFFNLDEGSLRDDDGLNATIDSDELNAINGIYGGRTLQVFTSGGEYSVPQSNQLTPITPSNISFKRQTRHGSPNIRPVSVDGATLFFDRKDMREFLYNDVEQSYISPSLNLLATHIISDVVDIDLRRSTTASNASYVFVINGDGTCAVLNQLRSQNITSWVKWTTNGEFKDVCVVGDNIYFTVERTINGSTVSYIEIYDEDLKLDSAIKQTASSTDTWSGLSHLNGETVSAFGDDFVIADAAIASGSTTTDNEHTETEFGLEYLFEIKTMPFAGVYFGQSAAGKRMRLVASYLRVNNTRNILVNGYRPPLINSADAFATTPTLVDDYVKINLGGYDRFAQVTITQDEPTEFTIYGLILEVGLV